MATPLPLKAPPLELPFQSATWSVGEPWSSGRTASVAPKRTSRHSTSRIEGLHLADTELCCFTAECLPASHVCGCPSSAATAGSCQPGVCLCPCKLETTGSRVKSDSTWQEREHKKKGWVCPPRPGELILLAALRGHTLARRSPNFTSRVASFVEHLGYQLAWPPSTTTGRAHPPGSQFGIRT